MKWIPVSERLPENENEVLMVDNMGDRYLGAYMERERAWRHEDGDIKGKGYPVTHWQPLPPAPTEG